MTTLNLKKILRYQLDESPRRTNLSHLQNLSKISTLTYRDNINKLNQLEKSLEKQNNKNQHIITYNQDIPIQKQFIIQNKLWKHFLLSVNNIGQKVQKQKINIWSSLMDRIIKQTDKKLISIQNHIEKLKITIKSKYNQLHSFYQQIQKTKNNKKQNKFRQNQINPELFDQKINIINQNCISIKQQIQQYNKQLDKIQLQYKKIQEQKLSLLKNILKQGYYRDNGMKWVFQQFLKIKYQPNKNDMPIILDDISKQCLLQQFQNTKNQKQVEKDDMSSLTLPSVSNKISRSNSNMNLIQRQNHLRKVYRQAKQYVQNCIKNKNWEKKQNKNVTPPKSIELYQWKQKQKKRICWVYDSKELPSIIGILFGTKIDSNRKLQ